MVCHHFAQGPELVYGHANGTSAQLLLEKPANFSLCTSSAVVHRFLSTRWRACAAFALAMACGICWFSICKKAWLKAPELSVFGAARCVASARSRAARSRSTCGRKARSRSVQKFVTLDNDVHLYT